MTDSRVMSIFVYKRLARSSEIINTPAGVFPDIWRLGQFSDTYFGKNVSNKRLLHASKCQGYSWYSSWVTKGKTTVGVKLTPQPRLGLKLKAFEYLVV